MPQIDVKAYLDQLRQALPYVPPLPVQAIKALHKKRDFGGIVRLIRSTMNVEVGLTIHWTSGPPPKGLEKAKAWISLPQKMPYYGTPAFKELKLDIFILKSFIQTSNYDEFAIVVAHELSHVVLESIKHPLKTEDLTAMLLGFSYLYRTAAHTIRRVTFSNRFENRQLGYLSQQEMDTAASILVPSRLRAKRGLLNYARENMLLIVYLGIGAAIWAGISASNKWSNYQIAAAEQSRLESQLPLKVNDALTLIGISNGLASVTRVFQLVTRPPNLSKFETGVRNNVCAAKKANIEKGISYINEYRIGANEIVDRIEVASCP
jgi:hypothetical protein